MALDAKIGLGQKDNYIKIIWIYHLGSMNVQHFVPVHLADVEIFDRNKVLKEKSSVVQGG